MKKFSIAFTALILVALACKKIDNGGGACGCSPVQVPEAYLTIKNSAGADLLNPATTGAYSKDKIQVYTKAANGQQTQLQVAIRNQFNYGNQTFPFYSLYLPVSSLRSAADASLYLKLDSKEYKLSVQFAQDKLRIEKLLADGKELPKDNTALNNFIDVFYLTE